MRRWDAVAIVVGDRAYGEADAIISVFTEREGSRHGLVRGARGRTHRGIWQIGNIVQASWNGRLDDHLGQLAGELIRPTAASAMSEPIQLLVLRSCCTVALAVLPQDIPHPTSFLAALKLMTEPSIIDYVRWELLLLTDLGYGLDLSSCAVSGAMSGLSFVSPKTGRALTQQAAGLWKDRLIELPLFLVKNHALSKQEEAAISMGDLLKGLNLTGIFLQRNAFDLLGNRVPKARLQLINYIKTQS